MSSGNTQTQKMETTGPTSTSNVVDDIENELIKITTSSNLSRSQQNAESSSIHSSAMSRTGPPHHASIKSEGGAHYNNPATSSIKSGDTSGVPSNRPPSSGANGISHDGTLKSGPPGMRPGYPHPGMPGYHPNQMKGEVAGGGGPPHPSNANPRVSGLPPSSIPVQSPMPGAPPAGYYQYGPGAYPPHSGPHMHAQTHPKGPSQGGVMAPPNAPGRDGLPNQRAFTQGQWTPQGSFTSQQGYPPQFPGGFNPQGVHRPQPNYAQGQGPILPSGGSRQPTQSSTSSISGKNSAAAPNMSASGSQSGSIVAYPGAQMGSYDSQMTNSQALAPRPPPQPLEKPTPELQNIVSTANLSIRLDLRKIALNCRNAEYNPKRFAAVIIRIRDPKTTALIFSSGKMVITGAKSEEKSETAARMYAKMIKKVGNPGVKLQDFKIQNIVGSCDVKFAISLESLNTEHANFSTYEPELFPGLIYRMHDPKIVLLIFASGKIVLTGAKTRDDIEKAFTLIYNVLKKYQKKNPKVAQPNK